jgi:serine/threonine protein phosphatase PrpC
MIWSKRVMMILVCILKDSGKPMARISAMSISVKGPGHIRDGLPNQDACLVTSVKTGWLAVVCDGMGSRAMAQVGSKQACRSVRSVVNECGFETDGKLLVRQIYQHWLDALGAINPAQAINRAQAVKPSQAVTTCLIAWLAHHGALRTFQLGDGLIMTVPGQQLTQSVTTAHFGNETTGLGISKKWSDWQLSSSQLAPDQAVVLMTDGISDDLRCGMEQDFGREILHKHRHSSTRSCKNWLKNELMNWATPHHQDDKSLALLAVNS